MRIRTAMAALALTAAGIVGTATTATATGHDFGDINIVNNQEYNVVTGCNPHFVLFAPSAQCGIFHIATP
ncbi:hypothetical protein ACWEFL_09545 [Streptomyces sp. NPDC004838]